MPCETEYVYTPATLTDLVNLCMNTVDDNPNPVYIIHNECGGRMEYGSVSDIYRCTNCGKNWLANHFDSGEYSFWVTENFKTRRSIEVLYLIEYNPEIGCFMSRKVAPETLENRKSKTVNEVFEIW